MASKSISKSVIWQLCGKFALQGIAFFTTPIFTRILTPADYGYAALYMSWNSIFGLILGFQTYGSFQNALLKYEKEELNKYYSSVMTISLLSFIICLSIAIVFNQELALLLELRNDLVILVICQSFSSYIIAFYVAKYNSIKQVEKSTFLTVFQALLSIVFSLLFVLNTKENKAIAKIYGNAIPIIIIGIILIIGIYYKGKCFWNTNYTKFCLSLALPLILHGIGNLVFTQSDRIMLKKMIGEDSLGIYSVSFTLCSILSIISAALNSAWIPFYYDMKKENKIDEIIFHTKRYLKFFTLITFGFILLAYDVYKIMAPSSYNDGLEILPLFVCSNYFHFLYLFPVNFEFYHEKKKLIPIGTLTAAIINIVINFLLIPNFGIGGAAIGTFIANLLLFLIHQILVCYSLKKQYEYRSIIIFMPWLLFIVIVCIVLYIANSYYIIRWILAILTGIYLIRDVLLNRSFF